MSCAAMNAIDRSPFAWLSGFAAVPHGDEDGVVAHLDRVRRHVAAVVADGAAGDELEAALVERARDRGLCNKAVGERAAAVRADPVEHVEAAFAVEHREGSPADAHGTALVQRDVVD